jgi:homeobox-leucine zipper protein
MAQEDVHLLDDDAGLALGLSLGGGGGGGGASDAARQGTGSSSRLSRSPRALEPSLTLSMPDEATATGSGGCVGGPAHSVSSLSVAGVKRERVEEADGERASSSAAAARACGAAAEDDDDGSTRKKLRLTKEQSALLEDRFKEHSTLNPVRTRSPRRARHDRLTDWSIVALPLHNTTMDR